MSDEDTHEINHVSQFQTMLYSANRKEQWIRHVLPYEEGSEVVNIEQPKYNFKHEDLDRSLRALYSRPGLNISHERTRNNFHFAVLDFCSSGGRKGHFFKGGRRYKVSFYYLTPRISGLTLQYYKLVMRRTANGPEFFYSIDQRGVKGNRDAEHKGYAQTLIYW